MCPVRSSMIVSFKKSQSFTMHANMMCVCVVASTEARNKIKDDACGIRPGIGIMATRDGGGTGGGWCRHTTG